MGLVADIASRTSYQPAMFPGLPFGLTNLFGGAIGVAGATSASRALTDTPPRFDAGDLYYSTGPSSADIKQDSLGDCFFVATLGAIADQQPQTIRDAISYDADTGSFNVTLYDGGKPVTINVTQQELEYNLSRGGGSLVDNKTTDIGIWPAVMETAYAKMNDSNPADGLKQGFDVINGGGKARDAMEVVTGDRGTDITYDKGFFEDKNDAIDRLAKQAQAALGVGRPLTLSTDPESRSLLERIKGDDGTQDGLVDNHVYVVESVENVDGEWQVTLRNPWGTNNGVSEGYDAQPASITVPLERLVDTGGLEYFNAGAL